MMSDTPETTNLAVVEPELAPTTALVALKPSSIPELVETVNAVDEAKKAIMLEKRDFMTIPGCKQPSLLKPGAEKLLKLFNLGCRFFPIEEIQDHDREYEYQKIVWANRQKTTKPESAKGWYFYKYRAELFDIASGTVVGDGYATCSSNERPDQPANTIIKMAQKSAMIAAVLITCNASGLFTQDVEDLRPSDNQQSPQRGSQREYKPSEPTPDGNPRYASEKQVKFAKDLFTKHKANMNPADAEKIEAGFEEDKLTMNQARDLINMFTS